MDTQELDRALRATLEDGRLSRAERQALSALLEEQPLDAAKLAQLRARAFAIAKERLADPEARSALEWAEDFVKVLAPREGAVTVASRACFSPGDECLSCILAELSRARHTADICVFTISDNEKQYDAGSDIEELRRAGIALRVDQTEHHMHHKFAVLDGRTLLNGSFNWTRSASRFNEENLIVTGDAALVATFARQFASMWDALG